MHEHSPVEIEDHYVNLTAVDHIRAFFNPQVVKHQLVSNCNFPLRTSDVHRGRTCLSLTHICCEDPKRIKVGTSAKCVGGNSNLVFPCDHKLDRLQELRF